MTETQYIVPDPLGARYVWPAGGGVLRAWQAVPDNNPRSVELEIVVNSGALLLSGSSGGDLMSSYAMIKSGMYRFYVPRGASGIGFKRSGSHGNADIIIKRFSVKTFPYNLIIQPTAAARPNLARMPATGRRNQLTYTEDGLQSVWTKANATAFNRVEGVTGFRENLTLATHALQQRHVYPAVRVLSLDARYLPEGQPRFLAMETRIGTNFNLPFINLDTGAVNGGGSDVTITTSQLQDGWWHVVAKYTGEAPADTNFALFAAIGVVSSTRTYQGDGISGLEFRNLQSEAGANATPYQKVANANDVTEAGVRDVWFLQGDGIDDALYASLPSGEYTRAFCNANGVVTIEENVLIDGQENILRDNQLIGIVYADRKFSDSEK